MTLGSPCAQLVTKVYCLTLNTYNIDLRIIILTQLLPSWVNFFILYLHNFLLYFISFGNSQESAGMMDLHLTWSKVTYIGTIVYTLFLSNNHMLLVD